MALNPIGPAAHPLLLPQQANIPNPLANQPGGVNAPADALAIQLPQAGPADQQAAPPPLNNAANLPALPPQGVAQNLNLLA